MVVLKKKKDGVFSNDMFVCHLATTEEPQGAVRVSSLEYVSQTGLLRSARDWIKYGKIEDLSALITELEAFGFAWPRTIASPSDIGEAFTQLQLGEGAL